MFTNRSLLRIFPVFFNVAVMLALLIGSTAFPGAVHADSTITVNTQDDNTLDDDLCSLREAINNANNDERRRLLDCIAGSGNDTIIFANGITTITLGSTLPFITDPLGLTIDGGGDVTISGNDLYQILIVFGPTALLTLDNLTVADGSSGVGAGVSSNGTLTIANSTFSGNTATLGGGVYSVDGILTITNSTFSGNAAVEYGGGVATSDGTLTITNSTFSGNTAGSLAGGGGIYNGSTTAITGSTFTNNTGGLGGGIGNYGGVSTTTTITNSTFSGNSYTHFGGGAVYNQSTLTITNSTFSDNNGDNGSDIYQLGLSAVLNLYNNILANNVSDGNCILIEGALAGNHNLIESTGINACGFTNGVNGNIVGSDPDLGTLADSPAYFPLNSGSPAIDAGDDAVCAAAPVSNTSQNGVARPVGAHCDIGSFEFEFSATTTTITYDGPDPSRVDQLDLIEVTVTGGTTPTGSVDITGADTNCTITLSGGMGSCLVNFASAGPKTLTATYNGDASHDVSSDTEPHIVALVASFRSNGAEDGWILESTETSNAGGTMDSASTTLRMGDDASDKQYRSILSFNTASLPNNAVIASIMLQTTLQASVGDPDFADFGGRSFVDVKNSTFGAAGLELADFITSPTVIAAGHRTTPVNGNLYRAYFNATSYSSINLAGLTQIRIRFKSDDDNDNFADYLSFYSGNTAVATDRPLLQILYYTP